MIKLNGLTNCFALVIMYLFALSSVSAQDTSEYDKYFTPYRLRVDLVFAGLADEYYESSTAYEDFYNLKIEPWEPNITTKVEFEKKWKDMVGKDGIGLFEGGGYVAKGVFRPREDCRMKSNAPKDFCPVCKRAISLTIDSYTK